MSSPGINAKASIDGAKKFQEDLKNMTARSKALDAEMKEMANRFEKEGKAMGDNAKQRQLANKQIEAQKEKVALLEKELKRLEEAGQGESAQAYKVREQLAKANTELTNMQRGSEKAASGTKDLTASMVKGQLAATAITAAFKGAVTAIKSIATGAANAAKSMWNLGVESGKWADELITLSNQTGVDTETLQEWTYAARFVDTEVSTMTRGMTKLTKAWAKGSTGKKKAYKIAKGVTVAYKKENGELKTQAEFYLDTIDALHGMTNVAQRNKAAQELFGKSYTDMLPLIEAGTASIREYSAEAREMGVIISGQNVTALGGFDDTMQKFDAQITAIKTNLAVAFLPVLELVSERLTTFMGTVSTAIADGLQPEDVGTIVNAFFDMFKLDPEGDAEAASTLNFVGDLIEMLKKTVVDKAPAIREISKTIMSEIWNGFKELIGLNPKIEFGNPNTADRSETTKNYIESLGLDADATAAEIRKAQIEATGILDKDDTIWQRLGSWFKSLFTKSNEEKALILEQEGMGADFINRWTTGVSENQNFVESAAKETTGTMESGLDGIEQQAAYRKWGADLATQYAAGIDAGVSKVSAASKRLAAAAKAPIHFSEPDVGPLKDFHTYAPDMIDLFVSGIRENAYKVQNALSSTLGVLPVINADNPAAYRAGSATTNYGGVNINVYGAEGQDVNQLADIIMIRMQNAVNRREAVFA